MGIFQYLVFLGIINIVFSFLWKWLVLIPISILFVIIKFDKGILVFKAFGAYLLISLTALTTLLALEDVESGWKLLMIPILGAFVLFMGFASNLHEQRKQARMNYDFHLMEKIEENAWFDVILIFGFMMYQSLVG